MLYNRRGFTRFATDVCYVVVEGTETQRNVVNGFKYLGRGCEISQSGPNILLTRSKNLSRDNISHTAGQLK